MRTRSLLLTFAALILLATAAITLTTSPRIPIAHAQERVFAADGTVAAPGITFQNNNATGIYRTQVGGALGITNNGVAGLTMSTTGALTVPISLTVTGAYTPTGGVAAAGGFTISPRLVHTGNVPAQVSTAGTDATPVITEVYIAEVFVPANMTVTGVSVMNGSVASGNIKVGLASSAGTVVATSASTAMSGTDAYQRIPFTGTYGAVGPATYFVLEIVDNTTARINTYTFGDFGAAKQTGQVYATGFTTITPPTTFTTALAPIASLY